LLFEIRVPEIGYPTPFLSQAVWRFAAGGFTETSAFQSSDRHRAPSSFLFEYWSLVFDGIRVGQAAMMGAMTGFILV